MISRAAPAGLHVLRRDLLRLVLPGLVAGCTGLIPGTGQPSQIYVLTRKSTFPADLPQVTQQQLLVTTPGATADIDTTRIALSRSPTTLDYFANAAWSDRAPLMVQALLIESFEASGRIVGISRDEAGLRADYMLMPELRRFLAVYGSGDGTAPVVEARILVRLVRMPERSIIGETSVERQQPAARNAMEPIVEAFDEALGGIMRDIVTWTLRRISEDAPRAGRARTRG